MKSKFLIVGVAVIIGCIWILQGQATSQDPPGMGDLLQEVDVDGDGLNTPGDRAVVQWWCAHGGDFEALSTTGTVTDGIRNVRSFLESPEAQLGD